MDLTILKYLYWNKKPDNLLSNNYIFKTSLRVKIKSIAKRQRISEAHSIYAQKTSYNIGSHESLNISINSLFIKPSKLKFNFYPPLRVQAILNMRSN